DGKWVPGRGRIDWSLNTTDNLFSASITHNYFTPDLAVGPTEPSSRVLVKENYNWNWYDPKIGQHWAGIGANGFVNQQERFRADLGVLSHTSYAHLALFGARLQFEWKDTL